MVGHVRKHIKYFFIMLTIFSMSISFSQVVLAGPGDETAEPEPGNPSPSIDVEMEPKSVTEATLSSLGYLQAATTIGTVWGSFKVLEEWDRFTTNFIRPLWNSFQSCYYAGQNPFASPLHICRGITRISRRYSLNPNDCRILKEFTAPIVMQLAQSLKENGGVLPRDFAFAKDTIRTLYLYGESVSGKSKLVLEELPKIFLRDPSSAIIVTNNKGFSDEEDVFNALFAKPVFTADSTSASFKRSRNVGERIKASAGRGIVILDDYTKYNTPALDKAIISLHDEGKINTPQGEIDCPAVLLFICSGETEAEFKLWPEQEAEKRIAARQLNESDSSEVIPEQVRKRRVGHPKGFVRRVRHIHLPRLRNENLRQILHNYFNEQIAPNILGNCRVELGPRALDELLRLNENRGSDLEHAFEMSAIQSAILDFKLGLEGGTQDLDLIVTFKNSKFQVKLKSAENLQHVNQTEGDLTVGKRLGCWASFNRRYGITAGISQFCSSLSSFCCCCQDPEELTDDEYLLSLRTFRRSTSVIMEATSFDILPNVQQTIEYSTSTTTPPSETLSLEKQLLEEEEPLTNPDDSHKDETSDISEEEEEEEEEEESAEKSSDYESSETTISEKTSSDETLTTSCQEEVETDTSTSVVSSDDDSTTSTSSTTTTEVNSHDADNSREQRSVSKEISPSEDPIKSE